MQYQKMLEETIGILLESFHFYGCLIQRCTISWTDKVPTAGVRVLPNSTIEMVINPEFFCMLTEKERVGLIMHEMLHLVNDHMSRSFGLHPSLANVAMDTAINQFIPSHYLPPGALTPATVVASENKARKAKGEKEIDMPKYEAFESYYNILRQEMLEQMEKFQNPHKFQGDISQSPQSQAQSQMSQQQQQQQREENKKELEELLKQEAALEEEKKQAVSKINDKEKTEVVKEQKELLENQEKIKELLEKVNMKEVAPLNSEVIIKVKETKEILEKKDE